MFTPVWGYRQSAGHRRPIEVGRRGDVFSRPLSSIWQGERSRAISDERTRPISRRRNDCGRTPPCGRQHVQQPGVLERFDGSGRGIGFCPRSPAIRRFQPENHSLVCKSMRRWLNSFASLRINERIVYGISHHANGPVSQMPQEYRL